MTTYFSSVNNIPTTKRPINFKGFGAKKLSDTISLLEYSEGFRAIKSTELDFGEISAPKTTYIAPFKEGGFGSNSKTDSITNAIVTDGMLECATATIVGKGKQYLAHIHNKTPLKAIVKDFTEAFGKKKAEWQNFNLRIIPGKNEKTEDAVKLILKAFEKIDSKLSEKADFFHFPLYEDTVMLHQGKLSSIESMPHFVEEMPDGVVINEGLNKIW